MRGARMSQSLNNLSPEPRGYGDEQQPQQQPQQQPPQSFDGPASAQQSGELTIPPPVTPKPREPWGLWLRLTGPEASQSRDAAGRERLRRARLLSVMLAVALVVGLAILPKGFIPVLDYGTL